MIGRASLWSCFMNRRVVGTVFLSVAALLCAVPYVSDRGVWAGVQPSIIPISWELNFRHGSLERISVPVEGRDRFFWFMRYTVVNNSGKDVLFTPSFELVADTGQVTAAF